MYVDLHVKYPFIVIMMIIIISFMQGTYIPQTNYVAREYSVAAFLLSSSSSPLCRVFILILLRRTMSLGVQCCSYSVVVIIIIIIIIIINL